MVLISVSEFVGRFHPVLVHLPIGFLLAGILLLWLSKKPAYNISLQVTQILLLLGMAGAFLSCVTGYLLSLTGEFEADLVNIHMWMGIGVFLLSGLFILRLNGRLKKISTSVFSISLLMLLTLTGHFGGSITHGRDYLTSAFSPPDTIINKRVIPDIQEAMVYNDVVQPILEKDCYGCHGNKKQKGKLRLDNVASIIKGGEGGTVLIAGKPEESELVKRLLLPKNHDDHMPPKSKRQLSENETDVIHWWISEGAYFDKKVKDLAIPEKLQRYLSGLETGNEALNAGSIPILPSEPVTKAPDSILVRLREAGAVVLPVAANTNYLMVNFVSAKNLEDEEILLLTSIRKQLLHLKLNNSGVGNEALKAVGACTNLVVLQLNGTAITDSGMGALKDLNNLRSLSIVSTSISLEGLKSIQQLSALRSLYLYQTKAASQDWKEIMKLFPKVMLDSGGYHLPVLATDTQVLR